ncbi:hypothetical protein SK128_024771 [Halocaridina rubra]|uniref:Uncharacterized protein n=1 Tax=Halocaridina rubra TaxID=373956 RepID=A0AAN8WSV5_HALRR
MSSTPLPKPVHLSQLPWHLGDEEEEKISDITKELSITNNVQQVQPIQSNAEGLEDTLKIHLAPFESLSSLPSYVSSLEDNLIAFHRRLGAVQASQNKEINHIKTLIENLEKSLALKKKST